MAENPLYSDSDYIEPTSGFVPEAGPGDGDKPKKKKTATEKTEEVPAWAKGKTVGDLPAAPAPKKPRKKRDFSAQEKALVNYADNDNVINRNPNTSSGTGGVSPMYLVQVEQDRAQAKKRQRELQQNVDYYNALNNDYVEDFVSEYFGGVEDILKGGNKFSQFIINTNTGLQVSDEALKRALDTEIRNNGGGNYTSSFYYSQIKSVANQLLGLWSQRDAANKELQTLKTKYDPKAYEQAILEQRNKLMADGKTKVEAERELSNQKVAKIQQQYEPVISDLGMDLTFYYQQTAEEVGKELAERMEGVSGISPVAIQNQYEELVQQRFNERYGGYVQDNVQPVVDAYIGAVNEEIGKANSAVKRITEQQRKSFLSYQKQKQQEFEQNRQNADAEAAGIVNKYIEQGVNQRSQQNKANTGALMYMSAMPTIGQGYAGKLFGNSFMAGLGRLRANTATFLKSVGFEADWIDEMQYGGINQQQVNSMGDAGLGEFGLTPGYWAKALGESAPTMIPGLLLSAVTRNPQVGMIISGTLEGADIAGGITNQIADETGDWGKATAAGREAFIKNIPTYFLEAPVHRLAAGFAGKTGKGLLLNVTAAGVSGGAQEWLQTGGIELPATEGKTVLEGLSDPQAIEAGVAGMGMEMMMGGAGAAMNILFSKVPNARTQVLTNSIVRHGMNGAIGALQQEALGKDATMLQNGMAELETINGMLQDANLLNLPVPQTQVYTALRQELSTLEQKAGEVKDPVLRSMVEKQAEEKKQEIEKVVRGEEKLATIELPMGLVFTGTAPQIGELLQIADIQEGIASGEVRIETEDSKLGKQVSDVIETNIQSKIADLEKRRQHDLYYKVELVPFVSDEDLVTYDKERKDFILEKRKQKKKQEDEINAKYDAELAALKNNQQPSQSLLTSNTANTSIRQYDDLVDALVGKLPTMTGLYGKFLEQAFNPEQQEFVAEAVADQYRQDFEAAAARYGEEVTAAVAPFLKSKVGSVKTEVEQTPPKVENKEGFGEPIVSESKKDGFTREEGNKVVDNNGAPSVLFHGTNNDSIKFDEGTVFYATSDKQFADVYGENKIPVQIKLKNPYDLTESADGLIRDEKGNVIKDADGYPYSINYIDKFIVDTLRERGYDGIMMGRESVIAFDKSQVKVVQSENTPSGINAPEITETIPEQVQQGIPKEIAELYAKRATLNFTLNALQMQMSSKGLTGKAKTEYENTKSELGAVEYQIEEFKKSKETATNNNSTETEPELKPEQENINEIKIGDTVDFYDDLFDETKPVKIIAERGVSNDGNKRFEVQFDNGSFAVISESTLRKSPTTTQSVQPNETTNQDPVQKEKPVKSAKPKKVKLSYRQRTNNLVDEIAKARKESNKTVQAKMINSIKLEIASFNKKYPDAGYKLDTQSIRLRNKSGNEVKKKNEVTNDSKAKDFDRANYSDATNRYVDMITADETLATGLAMRGIDGRRLSVEQVQKNIANIRSGKITEAGRELFEYIEQAVNDGFVEIEDLAGGMRAKVDIDEYFAATKETEQQYADGILPMEEAAILAWLEQEAENNYEEDLFDNVENLPTYEPDLTTTGNSAEQESETGSGTGEGTGGQEGTDVDEITSTDDLDAGAAQQRKDYLNKVADDFDVYNRLPKNKRASKLNAMSKRLQSARRDGVITEEDFNDVQNRINADYEALGSDVRVQQIGAAEDLSDAFEGEDEAAKVTNKEKAKEVADKIRNLRVKNDKLYGGFLGLPVAAYNGLLSAVAVTIEGGGSIADAIKNGYEAIKPYLTGEKFTDKEVRDAIAAELRNLGIAVRKKNMTAKQGIDRQLKNSAKTGTITLRELYKRRVKTEKDMGKLVNELQQAAADLFRSTIGTDLSKGRVAMVMEALQGLTNLKDPELSLLDVLEDIELVVREQQTANLANEVNATIKKLQKQFKRSGTLTERYKNLYKSLVFPRARKVLLATGAATLQQYNDLLNELLTATSAKQLMRSDSIEQVQNKLTDLNKLIAEYEQQRLYDKVEILAKKQLFTPVLLPDGSMDMEQSAEKYMAEREAEGSELEQKAAATKENVLRNYLPELQKEVSKEIENIEDKRLKGEASELVKVDVQQLDASELSELNDLLNNVLLDHYPDGIGNFLARVAARSDMQKIVAKAKDMVVRPINKETLEKKSLNALFQSLFYNEKAWSYFRSIVYQPWVTAANRVKAAMNGDKRRIGVAEEAERLVKKHKLGTLAFYRTEMYKFINRYNPAFPESREEQQQAAAEKLVAQIQAIYAEGVRNMNGRQETFDSKKMKAEALQQAEAAQSLGILSSYSETATGLDAEANADYDHTTTNLSEGEKAWVDFTYRKFEEIADDAEYSARSNFGQDFQQEENYTPFIPVRIAIDNNAAADAKVDGSISTFTDFGKKLSKQPTDRFKKRGRLAGDDLYYGMNGLENFYNGYYQTKFAIEGGRELIQTTSIINGTEFAKFVNGSYNPVFGEKNFGRGEQAELIRTKLSQVYKGYKYAPFKFTTMQDYENTVGQWVYSKMLETMVSSIDQIFKQPLPGMVQATIDIGPKYVAHALRIIGKGFASTEQADLLNRFFDNTSEEFRDAQSLDSFHKVVDEQNRPAWQSVASVPFNLFNYVGKRALVWADKQVLNRVLLMAGYLKGMEENGQAITDFDLTTAAADIDMAALAAAESTAQRINATSAKQEKADVVKMGQHKNWWEFGYTLRGFQLDAWNNFRNNLNIAFDRSGYLGASDPQRYAALKRAAAYLMQSAAYQGLVIWGTGMAWTALGQLAAEALMGAPAPEDDEKEKEKNTRRILKLGSNVVADALLGGQSVYVDAGAKVFANKLWETYQDAYRNMDGGKPKDYKGGLLDTRMKPFYVEESQAAGPMAALRYLDGVLDAVKETKTTGMDPRAKELKDRLERVQLALLVLNAGDLQKLNNYTIKALNEYGKQSSKRQDGMKMNMMKGGGLKAPTF